MSEAPRNLVPVQFLPSRSWANSHRSSSWLRTAPCASVSTWPSAKRRAPNTMSLPARLDFHRAFGTLRSCPTSGPRRLRRVSPLFPKPFALCPRLTRPFPDGRLS